MQTEMEELLDEWGSTSNAKLSQAVVQRWVSICKMLLGLLQRWDAISKVYLHKGDVFPLAKRRTEVSMMLNGIRMTLSATSWV